MGLILVANPGSSSRKYALFDHDPDQPIHESAILHIETTDGHLVGTLVTSSGEKAVDLPFERLEDSTEHLDEILRREQLLDEGETIERIGIRIVAPGSFFLQDHVITDEVIAKLHEARERAPLHIDATLHEIMSLRQHFVGTPIIGVSDSAFHHTKPGYAWNYGINIHDADRLDIKRFGYHGISVAASINTLWSAGKLPPKVVVCHLGSGSSVTAVFHGRSIDNTMGFSPNEGLIMATRSGTVTADAALALRQSLSLDDASLDAYLNERSGLLGLTGSNDIRELLKREADGDHFAHLGLTTLIHSIHKAIGSMIVAMNGCDMIVFTGTVGERSAILRKRIVAHLGFLDFILDGTANEATTNPDKLTIISQKAKSRPIAVVPTDEAREIAKHAAHASL